jgi:hypothetical protein
MDPSLEIQDWQRKPGLKNPLTPEQVEWLTQDEETTPLAMWDPQETAMWILAKYPEATLGRIRGLLYD